jgi:hypothetical protein
MRFIYARLFLAAGIWYDSSIASPGARCKLE